MTQTLEHINAALTAAYRTYKLGGNRIAQDIAYIAASDRLDAGASTARAILEGTNAGWRQMQLTEPKTSYREAITA